MSEYIEEPDTIRNELIDNGALSDKRMNEYIITCDEETAAWIGNDVDSMRPIVRCRDCRHFTYGSVECRKDDWCDKHEHIAWSVNGFCAWACRKEGAE